MVEVSEDHYEIDISRALDLLGWQPKRSLSKTLATMVTSLKDDPVTWHAASKLNTARIVAKAANEADDPHAMHDPHRHEK